jgi:DNA invertase Pin-like site-specific DNA recombinase
MKMANVAYRRVSSVDQNTARQLEGLTFDKEFSDKVSGGSVNRPALKECLGFLREGDTLHVHSIDRLARNLLDLQKLIGDLTGKGISVHFHKENLPFSGGNDPIQKLLMQMLGAVAEFERSLIRERQREGIAAAKMKGKHLGRVSKLSDNDARDILKAIEARTSVIDLSEKYGVTRQTIYNLIKKDAEGAK